MHLEWWTLTLQTVNFIVLIWLLHRFLYRPLLRLIDERRAQIERQYDEAKTLECQAQGERAGIAAERDTALREAHHQAAAAAQARRAQAEREAQALLSSARQSLQSEREQALGKTHEIALDLGAAIARRLLQEVPGQLREQVWLERVAGYLQALPRSDLEALRQQLGSGGVLRVISAEPLPAPLAQHWRDRLQAFLGAADVRFEVDFSLIAGADLQFPQSILRFSWRGVLRTLREQGGAHAHAV